MLHADAVVLAIDASSGPDDLNAVFAEFDGFLRRMEHRRGDRADVGGLPVFLVLTKCDRLARPGETTAGWLEHIEERKREVAARFHDFLSARGAANQPPGFGRLHLHVWATAVRRPALAGGAADPNDPYGVAELFRQCLRHAATYREQRERSGHRLAQMTLAAAAALALLLGATASLVVADALHRPPSQLEMQVEALRRAEPNAPADRLRARPTSSGRTSPRGAKFAAPPISPPCARTCNPTSRTAFPSWKPIFPGWKVWNRRRGRATPSPRKTCGPCA